MRLRYGWVLRSLLATVATLGVWLAPAAAGAQSVTFNGNW